MTWEEHEFTSPSLFPYALASVCSLWRDAMSFLPKFWSRIVFFVDPPATPLSAFLSQLSWSQGVEIHDIVVTRRSFHDSVDCNHEKAQIRSIMNILGPHIHRIRQLRFDVAFSSSLPSFPFDFRGSATILHHLELRCKEDDGGADHRMSVATAYEEFECPNLNYLLIDGRNYYEACKKDARWTSRRIILKRRIIATPRPHQIPQIARSHPSSQHLEIPGLHGIPYRLLSISTVLASWKRQCTLSLA